MSDEERKLTREGCDADVAAYALGALEPAEVEAFERHLAGCHACIEDVAAFQRVADTLATSTPQHPVPSGLRRRVMVSARSVPRHGTAVRRRGLWPARWIPPRVGVAVPALALGLAVVAILVSGGSSKTRVLHAQVIDSPGTAQVRLADGRAELIVRQFPPPPAGLIYEVWLQRPSRALAPTRVLFSVTAQGSADVGVPAQLHDVSEILVTPEPAGGSLIPTHQAVIVARLT